MDRKHLLMLIGVVIIVFIPFLLYAGQGEDQGYFTGADSSAGPVIAETGYQPWFKPIWEPPSGEMESLFFALEAAIGALIIGYFLGYYTAKKRSNQKNE
jgi:cobalt/nickel transport protein